MESGLKVFTYGLALVWWTVTLMPWRMKRGPGGVAREHA